MIEEWKQGLRSRSRRERQQRQWRWASAGDALAWVDRQKAFIVKNLGDGRFERAENAIVDLVAHQQRDSTPNQLCKSLSDLGATAARLRAFDIAERLYIAARRADGRDAVPHTSYAETLCQMGRLDDALSAYGQAKASFPSDVYAHNGYAETLREMGRFELAESVYREVLKRFDDEPVVQNALACLLIDVGRGGDARALLAVSEPETEQDWRDYHVIAMASLKDGDFEDAEKMFDHGMHDSPFHSTKTLFRAGLALARLRRRQYREVIEVVGDNVLEFRSPAVAILDGHARAELGELSCSEEALREAERSGSATVIRLSDAVRRRYGLGAYEGLNADGDVTDLDETISAQEFSLTLRPAAA